MQTQIQFQPIEQIEADALVILGFEQEGGEEKTPAGASANRLTGGWLGEIRAAKEFSGAAAETATLHRPAGMKAQRLLAAGAGKPEKFGSAELRNLTGAVIRGLKSKNTRRIAFVLEAQYGAPGFVSAAIEGAILGNYEPDMHITDPKKNDKGIDVFTVVVPGGDQALATAAEAGRIVAEAQNFARDLGNEPA
ncbi:MAG: M17 family peptidase N-terminal domain-containing protein, partial [Bryobacteraceae bacterium]